MAASAQVNPEEGIDNVLAGDGRLVDALARARRLLDAQIQIDRHAIVDTELQHAAQQAIARGIAALSDLAMAEAGEPAGSGAMPKRSILARDLRITVDLVERALVERVPGEADEPG